MINLNVLDPLFKDAAIIIVRTQQASTSLIQRSLKIGYSRAGKIIDQLEEIGIVGGFYGLQARETLIPDEKSLELFFNQKFNMHSNASQFTNDYYKLLKDFSFDINRIKIRLINNKGIQEKFGFSEFDAKSYISYLIVYELCQLLYKITDENVSATSLESMAFFLLTKQLISAESEDFLNDEYSSIINSLGRAELINAVESILKIGKSDAIKIGISSAESELEWKDHLTKKLPILLALKHQNDAFFEEYCQFLYHFSNIIIKADGKISKEEEILLHEIYKAIHNPLPQTTNKAKVISNASDSLDDVLEELNSLIGLDDVKLEINTLINFIKIQKAREQAGLKSSALSYHIIFTGNPGTGKTTVARIVAKIYKHLGILSAGQLVETDRSGLVAEYVGQTAVKVNKTVDSAINGILFIDEAYSLVGENKDDFGKEAIATLIKRMEDDRDKLVLVLAGYTKEMEKFIDTNPGFKSRFNRHINFQDYTPKELFEIFESKCKTLEYELAENAIIKLKLFFENSYLARDQSFGNGRFVRNIFEKTLEKQANRIAKENNLTKEILTTITVEDII